MCCDRISAELRLERIPVLEIFIDVLEFHRKLRDTTTVCWDKGSLPAMVHRVEDPTRCLLAKCTISVLLRLYFELLFDWSVQRLEARKFTACSAGHGAE